MKIRTKFALLIVCAGLISMTLFNFLWLNKWPIGDLLTQTNVARTQLDDYAFMENFQEQAKLYDLPESEEDTEAILALEPFFDLLDKYTGIYIYGGESGEYLAGKYAQVMDEEIFSQFFYAGYRFTDGEGEDVRSFPLEFRNGIGHVTIVNYHRALFTYPYLLGCLSLCVILFLVIVLFFISRKMKSVLMLEREVLVMASGDLTHPVPDCGSDEIGILAQELDHLRESLKENIIKEQESRKANQDLITALSHDLRTPLTVLNGYLEVMQLKRNPQMQEEYLRRCLKKTEDIKELTDRMFEYALVSEENEIVEMAWISTDFIGQCLQENCDFIKIAGFEYTITLPDIAGILQSDSTMMKRIFANLFSNILKYGDKKTPVSVSARIHEQQLGITISNGVKQEHSQVSSNNIGLKSVRKMANQLGGELTVENVADVFAVTLSFPLK